MIGNHDTKNVIMSNATLSGQHRTILIISLDCADLRPLTTMLESAGFDVQTAADRATAETIIGRQLPDLILLDIKLLPTGGHENPHSAHG
jgi:CheY-like chemotaxis protein